MLRQSIGWFALMVVATHLTGASAEAQVFVGPGGPVNLRPGYGYGYNYSPVYAPTPPAYVPPSAVPMPYSYYVLPSSVPSRIYVGPSEFPFYGHPYGHVYDRWSWPAMTTGSNNILARYYYPPLGG